jgi:hypothetical protein
VGSETEIVLTRRESAEGMSVLSHRLIEKKRSEHTVSCFNSMMGEFSQFAGYSTLDAVESRRKARLTPPSEFPNFPRLVPKPRYIRDKGILRKAEYPRLDQGSLSDPLQCFRHSVRGKQGYRRGLTGGQFPQIPPFPRFARQPSPPELSSKCAHAHSHGSKVL